MAVQRQSLTLHSDIAELARVAAFVEAFCAPLRPTEKDVAALQVALEEAVTNVIKHGYGEGNAHSFTLTLALDAEDRVSAVLTDEARAYDPLSRPPVDISAPLAEREIGGLGVHLMKKLMDHCRYERRDGKNVLTLERIIRRAT